MDNEKKTKRTDAEQAKLQQNEIRIYPPWNVAKFQGMRSLSSFYGRRFVEERTRVHEQYIREEAKTKRVTIIVAAVFLLGAIVVILFAPDGREIRSLFISAVLSILAAGCLGYKRVWGKTKVMSFGADTCVDKSTQQNDAASS